MGLIAIYRTEQNEYGYRTVPLSFEYSWKVGDRIKTEDGSKSCTIEIIESDSKINVKLFHDFVNSKKTISTPKLLIFDKKRSIEDQIKALKVEANKTKGKQLMHRYECSLDDLCVENIEKCFTKIITNGPSYFCKIIKRTDENELTEDDLKKIIPPDYFIFGPILALFERDYKVDNYCGVFGFIKNDIKYTLQLVHSISLESILKRLRMYKIEQAKQTLIELNKKKSDNEHKQKIKQAEIAKEKAKEAELLKKKKRLEKAKIANEKAKEAVPLKKKKRLEKLEEEKALIAKQYEMFKEKDSEKEDIENITKKKRRKRISE